ncbi:MAG: hypothetical protein QM731_22275 [Chitinophagaceae bacterium]
MRMLLHETAEIDRYLLHKMSVADRLVFHARMLIDTELQEKVRYQRKAHQLIRWWARNAERKKLDDLHHQLMKDEQFANRIKKIFT